MEEIEIRKTRLKNDVFISQTDVIILLMKMKNASLSFSCRQILQNIIDMIAEASAT